MIKRTILVYQETWIWRCEGHLKLRCAFLYSRYDDDLDEVEEEEHFEDVDDLEVRSMGKTISVLNTFCF